MVGADDDRIAIQELVGPAGRLHEGTDRRVAARERLLRLLRPERVGGEVVVGQVVDEEVEAVARDEPPTDESRVRVERAGRAAEDGDRRARHVGLEEVVEEEPLRPVGRPHEPGDQRQMARPAPVAGDVDRGGREPCVLEPFVHSHGLLAEVLLVHVEDRVEDRPARAGGPDRRERRAVLDQPPLAAVVPDEMRDVVHVGVRPGGDRREADRCQ